MVSEISDLDYPKLISIKHLGYIENGIELYDLPWAPAFEHYILEYNSHRLLTTVKVDMDCEQDYVGRMKELWPRALQVLKELVETS